jgi:hypothetical protein
MKPFIFILLLLVSHTIYGQSTYTNATLNDLVQQLDRNKTVTPNSPDIQGSPYLEDEFIEGEIYFDGKFKIDRVLLRLNLNTGDLEFQQKNVVMAIADPGRIDKVVMGEYVFIYIEKQKKGKVDGFVRMWNTDFPSVVTKMETDFLKKEAAKPYVEPKPDRFKRAPNKHYIMISLAEIEKISSVKKLISTLGEHEEELSEFAKKEKVSSGNVEELVALVNYYHSLQ